MIFDVLIIGDVLVSASLAATFRPSWLSVALAGDAARNVHPLFGQGVNLGFRDARQLVQVLLQRDAQQDCGNIHLLRRYERARKEYILSMQLTTDALKKLFNNDNPLLRTARNFGLSTTNHIAPLKKMLARHALN
jgi:2-polyprenyl-6-methoxyphenol hydroxylase-like FAD-dependent oxidoreductase